MKNFYEIVEAENVITNGEFTIRWTGEKTDPIFVAQDIARAIGHKNPTVMCRNFKPEYVDAERGKRGGRILMRSVNIAQVNKILSVNNKRLRENRMAFREFWNGYVLPEFDTRYAKREINKLRAELETRTAELKAATAKLNAVKSLLDN